jgi:antibiotic biosynthesis monooxygenase (ABM) superfamily enzyme
VKRPLRIGSWQQAIGVLPVSLLVNFVMTPITGDWPKLLLIAFNAVILVVALNWVLLPLLHWATRGRALQTHPRKIRTKNGSGGARSE